MAYDIKNNDAFLEAYKKLGALEDSNRPKYEFLRSIYKNKFDAFKKARNTLTHYEKEIDEEAFIISDSFLKDLFNMIEKIGIAKSSIKEYMTKFENLTYAKKDVPISLIIKHMNENDYSYIPILKENRTCEGIISEKSLIRLFDKKDLTTATVEKYLDAFSLDGIEKYKIVSINERIENVYYLFKNSANIAKIVLITEHGFKDEPLLGIITAWDFYNL